MHRSIISLASSAVLVASALSLHTFTAQLLPADKKCFAPSIVWGFTCIFLKGMGGGHTMLLICHIFIGTMLVWKLGAANVLLNRTILYPAVSSAIALLCQALVPPVSRSGMVGIALLQGWSIIGGLLMLVVFPATPFSAFEPQHMRDGLLAKFMRHVGGKEVDRLTIPSRSGTKLDAVAVKHHPSDRWILYLGGNSELMENSLEDMLSLREIVSANWVFYNPRGVGRSTGYVSEVRDLVDDAAAVIRFVTKHYAVNPKKLLLWGHSIGGGVAAAVVRRYGLQCPLLLDRTFTRLSDAAVTYSPLFPSLTRALIRYTIGDLDVVDDCRIMPNKKLLIYHRMDEVISYSVASPGRPEALRAMHLDDGMVLELRTTHVQSPHNSLLSSFEEKMELCRRINALFV